MAKQSGALITITVTNCTEAQAENFKTAIDALTPPAGVLVSTKLHYESTQ